MGIEYVGEAKMFVLETEEGKWKINLMGNTVTLESPEGKLSRIPLEVLQEAVAGIEEIDPLSNVQEDVGIETGPADVVATEELNTPKASSPSVESIEIGDIDLPEDIEPPTEEELKMLEEQEGVQDENIPANRPVVKMDDSKKVGKSVG